MLKTNEWDNGEYSLRAELDVTEQDTSSGMVPTAFENYLLELKTNEREVTILI